MSNLLLQFDYLRCEGVIKKHSKSFYRAFSQIKDPHRRRGIFSVYTYCRYVDDLIDVHHDFTGLMHYKNQLDLFTKGITSSSYRWKTLRDTINRFYPIDYDFKPFYQMIEGQEYDSNPIRISTVNQLLIYCDLVASSVGLMLLPILAPNKPELSPFATALGRAFQLTNILRDIGEDYRNNRIYLPSELMIQFDYSEDDLKAQRINDSFILMFEHLATIAEGYYQEAIQLLSLFDDEVRFPLTASLFIYREILPTIRHHQYQVMNQKQFVTDSEKNRIIKKIMSKELP
jgi:phytoene/squalene synthetase